MERRTLMNKSKTTAALGVGLLTLLGLNIAAAAPDDDQGEVKAELEGITLLLEKSKAEQGDAKVKFEVITLHVKNPKTGQEGTAGASKLHFEEHVGHEITVIEHGIREIEKDHQAIKEFHRITGTGTGIVTFDPRELAGSDDAGSKKYIEFIFKGGGAELEKIEKLHRHHVKRMAEREELAGSDELDAKHHFKFDIKRFHKLEASPDGDKSTRLHFEFAGEGPHQIDEFEVDGGHLRLIKEAIKDQAARHGDKTTRLQVSVVNEGPHQIDEFEVDGRHLRLIKEVLIDQAAKHGDKKARLQVSIVNEGPHQADDMKEVERQIGHLHLAAENLAQAKDLHLAHELHARAENMERELHRRRERNEVEHRGHGQPELREILAAIHGLRGDVGQLRAQVSKLRQIVKRKN